MALVDPSNIATRGMFISAITVTGASAAEVSIAHGLGRVPTAIAVMVVDHQDHTDITFVMGTHTSTNVLFTPTYSGGTGVLSVIVIAL